MILHEPTAIPDPKPIEAMAKCEPELSQLPVGFSELPVEEAIELLATNKVIDSALYWECRTKQEDERRWIEKQK